MCIFRKGKVTFQLCFNLIANVRPNIRSQIKIKLKSVLPDYIPVDLWWRMYLVIIFILNKLFLYGGTAPHASESIFKSVRVIQFCISIIIITGNFLFLFALAQSHSSLDVCDRWRCHKRVVILLLHIYDSGASVFNVKLFCK